MAALTLIALLGVIMTSESLIGDNEGVRNRTGMSQSCRVLSVTAEWSLIDKFES